MISGVISEEDFLEAQRVHRRPYVRRNVLIMIALVVVGAVVAMSTDFLLPGIVLFGAGAGGLIGEFLVTTMLWPRRHRRIYRQQLSLHSRHEYTWDEEGVSASSENGHAKRPWAQYVRIREVERMFLLYHSDVMFEMLPKEWFTSSQQIEDFRRHAARAVG